MRLIHRIITDTVSLLILIFALIWIYFQAVPVAEWGLIPVDAFWLMIVVAGLYFTVNIFSSLCLTTMREDSMIAKAAKSLVMTILVIAIFDWLLFPVLWIFGYDLAAEVKDILVFVSIVRLLVKIWLRRWFGGREAE
jgi:hypothetical protein